MDVAKKEDQLFDSWRNKYEAFVLDGAPCPSAFVASSPRTIFVLKDVNISDQRTVFDLREQLATAPNPWWRTIATWCEGISRLDHDPSWQELQAAPIKRCLEPFAFMQLKKSAGRGSVSNEELDEHACRDAGEIREQISIYRPRVIIACGVGPILARVLGGTHWRQSKRGVAYMELNLQGERTTYLINYMHPSARAAKNVVCFGLLDAYRDIVTRHGR